MSQKMLHLIDKISSFAHYTSIFGWVIVLIIFVKSKEEAQDTYIVRNMPILIIDSQGNGRVWDEKSDAEEIKKFLAKTGSKIMSAMFVTGPNVDFSRDQAVSQKKYFNPSSKAYLTYKNQATQLINQAKSGRTTFTAKESYIDYDTELKLWVYQTEGIQVLDSDGSQVGKKFEVAIAFELTDPLYRVLNLEAFKVKSPSIKEVE